MTKIYGYNRTSTNLGQRKRKESSNVFYQPFILKGSESVEGKNEIEFFSTKQADLGPYKERISSYEPYESLTNNSKSNDNSTETIRSLNEEYSKKLAAEFLRLLRNDTLETGYYSNSELFVKAKMKENPLFTKDWLNRVFFENFKNPDILVKFLDIISDIDYEVMKPQGMTMALAASSHQDEEVQEYSIRVFEKWGNADALQVLKYIKFEVDWLTEYLEQVIEDLEEGLWEDGVSS